LSFYSHQFGDIVFPEGIDALIISKPSNRRYMSGFTGSSAELLLTASGDRILITDFRYVEQARIQSPGFKIIQQGMDITHTIKDLADTYSLKNIGIEKEYITLSTYEEYTDKIPGIVFVPVSDPCEVMRRVKKDQELDRIKKAIEIADKTFLHIREYIVPGLSEIEIATEIDFFMRRLGSERNAFDTIVASGERSSLPHGTPTNRAVGRGDFVTMDFGAVFGGYCSDITRTIIIGQPDTRQEQIYKLVGEAQETAIRNIRPGMRGIDVDKIARDIISNAGYGENFGHGLGHGVGLDIHEGPRFSTRDDSILEPGMVVTVEPGVYIPGWGGVRIEDIIVVTSQGCEVLTKAPKSIQDMIITHK